MLAPLKVKLTVPGSLSVAVIHCLIPTVAAVALLGRATEMVEEPARAGNQNPVGVMESKLSTSALAVHFAAALKRAD